MAGGGQGLSGIITSMDLSYDILQAVENSVIRPDFLSALYLLAFSFANELISLFPYIVVLSGQLLFVEGSMSAAFFTKLFFLVAAPISVGTALGSLLIYGLAYFGGKPAIERFGKYARISWDSIEKVRAKFKGAWYDEMLFLALRAIPFLPSLPLNAAAGVLRMPPAPYLVLTIVGTAIRVMLMFAIFILGAEGLEELAR